MNILTNLFANNNIAWWNWLVYNVVILEEEEPW